MLKRRYVICSPSAERVLDLFALLLSKVAEYLFYDLLI
jgi:hypothetical protein